ncbi:MAG: HPr(Ser) kinase/phosphatase [Chlamydiae bacterium]|nr:HPr(Ser) kinase/phosphatase [Chlamydiota bacterium]MBI3267057.1 HPr(Ser) kinase/phosphatase [Chlamydiota bacterium]
MSKGFTVEEFFQKTRDSLQLRLVAGFGGLKRRIKVAEVNRPGLALAGYFDYFARRRVQVLGKVELIYLKNMDPQLRRSRIIELLDQDVPCCIVSRQMLPPTELVEEAEKKEIPVFRSPLVTMILVNKATLFLEDIFAAVLAVSADLVEVFGVGVLIRGESGVGKSECALSLIERGHRLISDDVVRVRYTAGGRLLGTGDPLLKHHLEVRGLGIINIQTLFGASCVMQEKEVELVVSLEDWKSEKEYDRLGMDEQFYRLFDVDLPHVLVPVRPGRDLALLVEVAALNQRLRKMGYHASRDLNQELIEQMRKKTVHRTSNIVHRKES